MKIPMIGLLVAMAAFAGGCANPELPASSRVGQRQEAGNADLRLPSQWGSQPADRRKWWQGPETRYPNPGYYSSENR